MGEIKQKIQPKRKAAVQNKTPSPKKKIVNLQINIAVGEIKQKIAPKKVATPDKRPKRRKSWM